MNPVTLAPPLTALEFLLDQADGDDTTDVLARELSKHDVARSALSGMRRLSGSALRAVDGEIAAVAAGLLDLGLGDAVARAWRKYTALTRAAEHTLAAPESEEIVVLATHRVTWAYRPHIDLLVDGKKITTFEFEMTVVNDLDGVVAVVRQGKLAALRGGACTITATLALEGAVLARRQGRTDAALLIPLDPPIPLLGGRVTTSVRVRHATDSSVSP
jgi:hypothetical protein